MSGRILGTLAGVRTRRVGASSEQKAGGIGQQGHVDPLTDEPAYIPSFDGLRFVAALAVVAFHTRLPWFGGGFLGVDVFLVLSGYLTVVMLERRSSMAFLPAMSSFLAARFRRLWPLLATVSLCAALWRLIAEGGATQAAAEFLLPTLFVSNLTKAYADLPVLMQHSWTVATELKYYVVVATIYLGVGPSRRGIAAVVFLALYLLAVASRYAMGVSGAGFAELYYLPVSHGAGVLLGAVIAIGRDRLRMRQWRTSGTVFAASVVLGVLIVAARFQDAATIGPVLCASEIVSAVLVAGLVAGHGGAVQRLLALPVIARLGIYSYGIYLWHYPIARHLRYDMPPAAAFLATFFAALALSVISYRLVETRFHKGLDRRRA